jgi:hypothetical protein
MMFLPSCVRLCWMSWLLLCLLCAWGKNIIDSCVGGRMVTCHISNYSCEFLASWWYSVTAVMSGRKKWEARGWNGGVALRPSFLGEGAALLCCHVFMLGNRSTAFAHDMWREWSWYLPKGNKCFTLLSSTVIAPWLRERCRHIGNLRGKMRL